MQTNAREKMHKVTKFKLHTRAKKWKKGVDKRAEREYIRGIKESALEESGYESKG